MIRYHSFYPWHREGAVQLPHQRPATAQMLKWVRAFNPYDLYSKGDATAGRDELRPFYEELIAEFFPEP